jgi:hypothetical protein
VNESAGNSLPDYMPIVSERMTGGNYRPFYEEREITQTVDLCDAHGDLNPAAVGWSRRPLVRANLSGHWPRKKKWNFWNWISPRFVFSVTLADIDYASFCGFFFTDFETRQSVEGFVLRPPHAFTMPQHVEETVRFSGRGARYSNVQDRDRIQVEFEGRCKTGENVGAEFVVRKPAGHESLNIVVPWTSSRFQLNSKHNTLPCEGQVTVGGRRYVMEPHECHAVQDFGRGMWPYRSFWNWGVCTGAQDGNLIGVNFGAKWTTGTGVNENGICFNGRLYKVMEDLHWEYDPADAMKPWRVCTEHSGMIDLTLQPMVAKRSNLSLGFLASGGVCSFGRWTGTLRFDGNELRVDNLIGWAEEFAHRW